MVREEDLGVECLLNTALNLDAKALAMLVPPLTPSTGNRRKMRSIRFNDPFNIQPDRILSLCEGMGKPITNKILASAFNTTYFKSIPSMLVF